MSDWQTDAELAGTLYRKSKPYTAMLIARCVDYGEAGKPRGNAAKCSIREFVDESGISNNTVAKYLKAWDALAQAGLVPGRGSLEPGEDIEIPDQKQWTYYYREANPPAKPKEPKAPDPSSDALDVSGRVDLTNKRVQTALKMLDGIGEVPKQYQGSIKRVSEALNSIGFGDNPNRAFVSLCSALTDLTAEMNR